MPNPTYAEMMNELYGESAENTLQFAIEFQRNALRALERNDVGEAIMELHGLLGTLVELAYRCDLNVDFNA